MSVPTTQMLLPVVNIKLDGSDLSDEAMHRVTEVVIEQSLHLPDMFVIRLHDFGDDANPGQHTLFKIVSQDTFAIGKSVEILAGWSGGSPASIVKGEITSVEMDATLDHAPLITVRGYAKSHRLHRGRQSKSYLQMSDSDIASSVAQAAGLQVSADSTSVVHDYILQHNQTNWDFLKERAARIGYELFMDGSTLHFRKPQRGQTKGPEQTFGQNLLSIRVKVSASFQSDQVTVRAWDPTNKQAIVGQATSGQLAPTTGISQPGSSLASSAFSSATTYVVNVPVATQSEANNLAQAIFNDLDGTFIQAEGVSMGDASIKPGLTATIKSVGPRLSGDYYITSTTHTINPSQGGYTTAFVVSGRQTNSVLELMEPKDAGVTVPSVVIGVVTNNQDPDGNLGRVKVKFPWLDDNDESYWARIASPMAGSGRGFLYIPEVNDEVLVSFEQGDMTRPFILGGLWNGKDAPPKKNSEVVGGDGKVNQRIIQTRAGHIVNLDDTQDAEKITITSKSGHVFTMDDKSGSETVSIVDKTGNNLIKIESSSNKITIQANGDISVTAKQNATVEATQNVTVKSDSGNITVQAPTGNVSVESQSGNVSVKTEAGSAEVSTAAGSLSLKGMQVTVEAQGMMSLKSSGILQIQGSLVQIN